MLDEQSFIPLRVLKDDPGLAKLNWFTYFILKTTLEKLGYWNPGLSLMLKVVPFDKTGKTSLDYVSCASESFK